MCLHQSAQRTRVRREGAKKERLASSADKDGRKILHLHRVYQVALVFNIYPHKFCLRKFALHLHKNGLVGAAGVAPLCTQAGHQQGGE